MKAFIVATIALISVSVCAANGGPSAQYLPPRFGGAAPSNQYLAPHGGAGGAAHYHGVDGGAHHAAPAHHAPVHHAPSAAARFGGGHHGGPQIPIVRSDFTHDVNSGSYNFGFETGNGIRRDETGEFIGGWPHGSQSVKGSYSYTGDDGRLYTVNYTADEHGFRAQGDHLPVNNQAHAVGHGSSHHGQHGHSGGFGGGYPAASAHAPSSQYLPPQHHQQQQQHGGYNYARHRSH